MKESRQKDIEKEMINPEMTPPSQGNTRENCEKEPEEPMPDLFRLKLVIGCIVILNLIFGFYALKSDRFVTQPQESDSVQKKTERPNPSSPQNQIGIQDHISAPNQR
jgi:hypothetical protein